LFEPKPPTKTPVAASVRLPKTSMLVLEKDTFPVAGPDIFQFPIGDGNPTTVTV
jgi:hypothetical protein